MKLCLTLLETQMQSYLFEQYLAIKLGAVINGLDESDSNIFFHNTHLIKGNT